MLVCIGFFIVGNFLAVAKILRQKIIFSLVIQNSFNIIHSLDLTFANLGLVDLFWIFKLNVREGC